MEERVVRNDEVVGSIPISSTILRPGGLRMASQAGGLQGRVRSTTKRVYNKKWGLVGKPSERVGLDAMDRSC